MAAHPQRVLVTASARWALPSHFQCMHEPVGVCVVGNGNEAMPLYLATEGWGYVIERIPSLADSTIPIMPPPTLEEPEDWLVELRARDLKMYDHLAINGIHNDEKYLRHRGGLRKDLRVSVDA